MFLKKLLALSCMTLLFSTTPVLAKLGTETGGGGDASEVRVNEIRADILKWIEAEGAKGLVFPGDMSYGEYVSNMVEVLQPQKVIIAFTEEKVIYDNAEKTCRGYFEETKSEFNILCNISRFAKTTPSDQYKLIHHEYAGLARVEKNEGAISDYNLSSQITNFLNEETVLRLSVKKMTKQSCTIYARDEDKLYLNYHDIIKSLKKKKYKTTSQELAEYSIEEFFFSCTESSLASSYINEQGLSLFHCDKMHANLTLKNNKSGELQKFVGSFSKTEKERPTAGKVTANLIKNIPKCRK